MQTFTFYASEDKLENRGNYVAEKISVSKTLHGTLRRAEWTHMAFPKFSEKKMLTLFRILFCFR